MPDGSLTTDEAHRQAASINSLVEDALGEVVA